MRAQEEQLLSGSDGAVSMLSGVGGAIVSKQAIGLNVSRTEILRKTCPVSQVAGRPGGVAVTRNDWRRAA